MKRAFSIRKPHKAGFLEAASIGIGGMVGGGILAVLGLAVAALIWRPAAHIAATSGFSPACFCSHS